MLHNRLSVPVRQARQFQSERPPCSVPCLSVCTISGTLMLQAEPRIDEEISEGIVSTLSRTGVAGLTESSPRSAVFTLEPLLINVDFLVVGLVLPGVGRLAYGTTATPREHWIELAEAGNGPQASGPV